MQKYIPDGLKTYMWINRVNILQESVGAEEKFLVKISYVDVTCGGLYFNIKCYTLALKCHWTNLL